MGWAVPGCSGGCGSRAGGSHRAGSLGRSPSPSARPHTGRSHSPPRWASRSTSLSRRRRACPAAFPAHCRCILKWGGFCQIKNGCRAPAQLPTKPGPQNDLAATQRQALLSLPAYPSSAQGTCTPALTPHCPLKHCSRTQQPERPQHPSSPAADTVLTRATAALCCAQPCSPARHRLRLPKPCTPREALEKGIQPYTGPKFRFPVLFAKVIPETGHSLSEEVYKPLQNGPLGWKPQVKAGWELHPFQSH